jgi:curved DNA-binding protein CbpA
MQTVAFIDHYEALQISHNADTDTIHRVYRILAQRLHPDNHETGNTESFQILTESYRVLSDPEKRASYDVQHCEARRLRWQIFDQSTSFQGVDAERRKREGVLSLLYRKRVMQPDQPALLLKELEELLGVPREHLEFALWFLKESQLVQRTDNGRHIITLKGAEAAEGFLERKSETLPRLTAAPRADNL